MTRVLIVAPYAAVRAGLHALLGEAADLTLIGACCPAPAPTWCSTTTTPMKR